MNLLPPDPHDDRRTNPRALYKPQLVEAGPVPPSGAQSHHSLLEFWELVRRQKLVMTGLALAGIAGGLVALVLQPPLYKAYTTLELQGFNESFMNLNAVDPQAGTGLYSANQLNLQTQVKIIGSASLRAPALERLERESTPVVPPQNNILSKLRSRLRLENPDPMTSMKEGLRLAALSAEARVVTGTRLITISCESTHPELASGYANALASDYISQSLQFRATSGQRTNQWLSSQIEETRMKLEQAEDRLQQFVRNSGLVFVAEQDTLATSKLKQLQTELSGIQSDRIAKQARYEMTLSSPADAIPEVQADPELRTYNTKLTDLQRERALLLATLTSEHYKVKRLDAQIDELEKTMQKEKVSIVQRIRNEYEAALKREKTLAAAYQAQSKAVSAQADKAAEHGILRREVEMLRQSLNAMLQQANQAGVMAGAPTANIRVIDSAAPPALPYKPVPLAYAGAGLALGALLGAAAATLRDKIQARRRERRFGLPGSASNLLQVRELGVIPSAHAQWRRRYGMPRWRRPRPEPALAANGRVELATLHHKPSLMADSFRMVLASIAVEDRAGLRPRVMVISSPGPGEGKTTVASNLAIAMAGSGRHTLLIDADFRKPGVGQIFELNGSGGFGELIFPSGSSEPLTPDMVIRPTVVPGLDVLPSGSVSHDVLGKLFYSPSLQALFERLRADYDAILIDTPPLLQFSDARLLGRVADGVIVVIRSGLTDSDSALACRQRLLDDGIPVLGTVLNDWNPSQSENRPYYQRYYHYYHDVGET